MLPCYLGLGYHTIILLNDVIIMMMTISDEGWKVRLSRLDALFHSSHLGSEFRVLVLRLSVPNRVWVVMGFTLSYLPSSKQF